VTSRALRRGDVGVGPPRTALYESLARALLEFRLRPQGSCGSLSESATAFTGAFHVKDMIAALRALDFKQFNEIVSQLDMLEVLKNPWVIVAMVIPCIVFVIRGMEKALVGFLSSLHSSCSTRRRWRERTCWSLMPEGCSSSLSAFSSLRNQHLLLVVRGK